MPEVIPSLEFVQQIIILVLYLANIVFAYVIVLRFKNYLQKNLSLAKTAILTSITGIIITLSLAILFIFTSLGIGQGFLGGSVAKELNYPNHKVTLYLYDNSFMEQITTIKMKHKTWPIMEDVSFIEHCHPSQLKIWRHDDIVEFSYLDIYVRINLITRNAKKFYAKPEDQN